MKEQQGIETSVWCLQRIILDEERFLMNVEYLAVRDCACLCVYVCV